jgi:hypothetical protein
MDLYENEAMQALTDCTLTENKCYPPLQEEADPKFVVAASDKKSLAAAAVETFDLKVLEGPWFVAAGWNPTFDCFPCSRHVFDYYKDYDDDGGDRLEATFSYRITRDDGSVFTRSGDKTITRSSSGKNRNGGQHQLRLRPDRMNYVDHWTILAYEPDEYVVVYYHGSNVAWKGYSGLNVYTRCVQ